MLVSYRSFPFDDLEESNKEKYDNQVIKLNDPCPLCRETLDLINKTTLKKIDVIAHLDGGDKHPMHLECAKLCAKFSDKCPSCFKLLNTSELFSVKDKLIAAIQIAAKNTFFSFYFGVSIASTDFLVDIAMKATSLFPVPKAVLLLPIELLIFMTVNYMALYSERTFEIDLKIVKTSLKVGAIAVLLNSLLMPEQVGTAKILEFFTVVSSMALISVISEIAQKIL